MSDIRSETLAQMKRIATTLIEAKERAVIAQARMDDCAARVRGALDDAERYSYIPLHQASEVAGRIIQYVRFAIDQIPVAAQTYGDAMEVSQRAATMIIVQAEGSTSELPHKAIAAAASAQLSWSSASGNALSAMAKLQDALTVPQNQLEGAIREAAGVMISSDRENTDAMNSCGTVDQCVTEYEGTI